MERGGLHVSPARSLPRMPPPRARDGVTAHSPYRRKSWPPPRARDGVLLSLLCARTLGRGSTCPGHPRSEEPDQPGSRLRLHRDAGADELRQRRGQGGEQDRADQLRGGLVGGLRRQRQRGRHQRCGRRGGARSGRRWRVQPGALWGAGARRRSGRRGREPGRVRSPPPDGGPPDDGGSSGDLYGAPPPQDAGPDDGGNNNADYGAPPPP